MPFFLTPRPISCPFPRLLLLFLLLLAYRGSRAQVVGLTGAGFAGLEGERVWALRPVPGGYLNCFYKDLAPVATIRQGQFQLAFAPRPGGELVSLQAKTLPQLYAFVEPGGAPVLLRHLGAGPMSEATLTFEGPNAAGNNLLLQGRLLNRRAGVDQERVRQLMAPATTPQAMLRSLRGELRLCLSQLDSARRRHLISPACYAVLRANTEQTLLFWVGGLLSAYTIPKNQSRLSFRLPEAGLRQVLASLEKEFDPYGARYQGLFITTSTAYAAVHFRATGWLPGPPLARHWNQYAAQFKDINSAFGDIDYAPTATRSLLLGNELLTALAFSAMSNADFATVFTDYGQQFPTSPYVPVLTQALLHEYAATGAPAAAVDAAPANPNQDLGHYEAPSGQLTFASVVGLDTVATLAGLVRRQFAGRPVFVDFWATWCAPCVAEFGHEPALYAFLAQQGIEPLYVSVNNPNYRAKWREFITQYKLRGSHYLANAAVQKSLAALLARGIPRYLLFDAQGRLVDDDLPLPSSGEALQQRIRQKLAGK